MLWVRRYHQLNSNNKHTHTFKDSLASVSIFCFDELQVGKFTQLLSTFLGGFVIALIKGWLLTLVLLSSIPALAIAGGATTIIVSKMAFHAQNAYAKGATVVEQTIGSIRIVASFTRERQTVINYNKSLVHAYKSVVQEGLAAGFGFRALMFVAFSTYSLAIWFGAKMILEKGYTGGKVLNVIVDVLTGSMSLGQASPCMSAFAAARPNEQIFSRFSLFIPSGTTTALVRKSGSEKSTVTSLIERFYDPQAGEVFIDGINLKEFQLNWIRRKIGLVSQEPVLFTCSIKDNISYGKHGATIEEVKAAAELANATKFIDKLPQTEVKSCHSQSNTKDLRILLLDEATSALDAESEKIVQEALDRIMANKTTVIVAHRLSTVRNADMIAVIQQGQIVEKELLQDPEGAYYQFIRLQEVNKDSKQVVVDQDKSESIIESSKQSSQRMSFLHSISHGSSGAGNNSRHLSVSFGLPTGFNVPETVLTKAEASYLQPSDKTLKVPLRRLAYLNKPEVPVLIAGTITAIVNGSIFPIFGLLLSNVIKTFYEPPHE
ncbi:ABC transporter B family member 4 [Camellia lanceoleosa]|uniref:ABC transporter B family member 4 n=1 Tax=Camellia lanceoleosa TaxID=1840588 RepID=A0ACC0F7J7_9ERIC|nr:ABC transporter B family member 4 [Camellia lanceoleosa]